MPIDIEMLWKHVGEELNERKQTVVDILRPGKSVGKEVTDLAFLKELRDRIKDGMEKNDPAQIEYALKMAEDWIHELEKKS